MERSRQAIEATLPGRHQCRPTRGMVSGENTAGGFRLCDLRGPRMRSESLGPPPAALCIEQSATHTPGQVLVTSRGEHTARARPRRPRVQRDTNWRFGREEAAEDVSGGLRWQASHAPAWAVPGRVSFFWVPTTPAAFQPAPALRWSAPLTRDRDAAQGRVDLYERSPKCSSAIRDEAREIHGN